MVSNRFNTFLHLFKTFYVNVGGNSLLKTAVLAIIFCYHVHLNQNIISAIRKKITQKQIMKRKRSLEDFSFFFL